MISHIDQSKKKQSGKALFCQYINTIHQMPEVSSTALYKAMDQVYYPQKEVITWQGDTERYLYFVIEGIQRSYYVKDEKEHIIAFTYPPSFTGIPESFLTQNPSKFYLKSITDSRLLRICRDSLNVLMVKDREIERLVRKATEQVLAGLVERYFQLMALSMEERFKKFMNRSGHLIHKIPHKYLASYLNMDPTNFSKLLGKTRI